MSVVGSLAWIGRVCRPEMLVRSSKLQQARNSATVNDLRAANKAVRYAKSHSERGLVFRSGVIDWDGHVVIAVITDASHGDEQDEASGTPYRSQGGRIVALATPNIMSGGVIGLHVIGYASNSLQRVVSSTMQAETYQLQLGVEAGDVLRAAFVDLMGKLDHKQWERTAAEHMQMCWLTDCKSAESALIRPVLGKHSSKRLGMELASLRQCLWRRRGEAIGDAADLDERPTGEERTDHVRWVDTDVMPVDPLTKIMEPEKLLEVLEMNRWDSDQPLASLQKKRVKQAQRKAARRKVVEARESKHVGGDDSATEG